MDDRDTLELILEEARPVILKKEDVQARTYSSKPLHVTTIPPIESIEIHSLHGLVEYANKLTGVLAAESELIMRVQSPEVVTLSTLERDEIGRSEVWAIARPGYDVLFYSQMEGKRLSQGEMFTALKTLIEASNDQRKLIEMIGRITSVQEVSGEVGVSAQAVTMKSSVSVTHDVIQDIVVLRPFRTFSEIEQPTSRYLFRMVPVKDGIPDCIIREIRDGQWRMEAMKSIISYLRSSLESNNVPDSVSVI